jgi:hypothetical protein
VACPERALAAHRDGAAGRSAEDLRRELGALGVQLAGGESFRQLQQAVLEARRRDATKVDWAAAAKKPGGRKQRECCLCPHPILPGEEYLDGGSERAAHLPCGARQAGRAGAA